MFCSYWFGSPPPPRNQPRPPSGEKQSSKSGARKGRVYGVFCCNQVAKKRPLSPTQDTLSHLLLCCRLSLPLPSVWCRVWVSESRRVATAADRACACFNRRCKLCVVQHSSRRTVGTRVRARRPVISPATGKSSPWSRSPARAPLAISPGSTTSQRTTSGTGGGGDGWGFTVSKPTREQWCGAQ